MIDLDRLSGLEQAVNEDIQRVYVELFGYEDVDLAKELKEKIGISPDTNFKGMKEAVQEGYLECFEYGDIKDAIKLKEITGVEPIMDEEAKKAVQIGYLRCFKNCYPRIDKEVIENLKKIKKFTGVLPSAKLLAKYPQFKKHFGDSK